MVGVTIFGGMKSFKTYPSHRKLLVNDTHSACSQQRLPLAVETDHKGPLFLESNIILNVFSTKIMIKGQIFPCRSQYIGKNILLNAEKCPLGQSVFPSVSNLVRWSHLPSRSAALPEASLSALPFSFMHAAPCAGMLL